MFPAAIGDPLGITCQVPNDTFVALNCPVSTNLFIYLFLYNNQINARALIGQSAVVYCAGKPTENRASSELLYKSNKPQVFYGL